MPKGDGLDDLRELLSIPNAKKPKPPKCEVKRCTRIARFELSGGIGKHPPFKVCGRCLRANEDVIDDEELDVKELYLDGLRVLPK